MASEALRAGVFVLLCPAQGQSQEAEHHCRMSGPYPHVDVLGCQASICDLWRAVLTLGALRK